jgi:NAD(P)H-dependent FMN reductase
MPPMSTLIISTSLNPDSRSRRLARVAESRLRGAGSPVSFVDVRDLSLPPCDASGSAEHPGSREIGARIAGAHGIILAFPIYNYDGGAAAKNLIELTGKAWRDRTVALIGAAGGRGSYMAPLGLANSLLLDFQCTIVPRIVVVTEDAFDGDELIDLTASSLLDDMLARYAKLIRL